MRVHTKTVQLVAAWAAVFSFSCGETISEKGDTETETAIDSESEPDGGEGPGTDSETDDLSDGGDPDGGTELPVGDFEERARELISRMTLEEKVSQMGHDAPAIERLGIPKYYWWNEALHGVAFSGVSTVFPQAISLASTFNPELLQEVATAISTEARVRNNEQGKGLTYWSPTINLARDPRWGRNEETYGEDPYLTSRMAVSFVRGMQGDDPVYLKTVSTIKHFVANNIEATRHSGSSDVDERNLRELYMPAFRAAVEEADVQSLMCAYNRVNGVPSCASDWLLQDVLRDEWGFSGYVVSDCWAVRDIVENHQYVSTNQDASRVALAAGTDLNCGDRYQADLVAAVQEGAVDEAALDNALYRLFLARFKLGEFDPPSAVPYREIPNTALNSPEHAALAERTAVESMILLKNDGTLPLDPAEISSIAVVGPNAAQVVFGLYSGTASSPTTVWDSISRIAAEYDIEATYSQGTALQTALSETGIADAAAAAAAADVTVAVLGSDLEISAEARDRASIDLPAVQQELLEAVQAANPNTILVLVTGGPWTVTWADENLPAVLNAGYGGQAAGDATAAVLFGEANPAGRLPQTYYRSMADLPDMNDYDIIGGKRTYMYFDDEVLYPFGHGLSYTQFTYENLSVTDSVAADGTIEISVDVTNSGERDGDEVVQIYVTDLEASVPVPVKQLKRFSRISLSAGEQETVTFSLPVSELAFFDTDAGEFRVEPGVFEVSAGASSEDIRVRAEVTVTP